MRKRNRLYYNSIIMILALLLGAGCVFYGFRAYERGKTPESVSTLQEEQTGQETGADSQEEQTGQDTLTVHFIDVGHGDAALITCGQHAMLVDCGKNIKGRMVSDYVREQGVDRLDYLILTHPDNDHIGGAPVILEDFRIENILVSSYAKASSEYELLKSTLEQNNLETRVPVPGEEYTLGEAVFTILGPVEVFEDSNNSSIVFRLDFGERSFLFAGDQEKKAEKALLNQMAANAEIDVETNAETDEEANTETDELSYKNLQADVLKVGHHGKNDACGKKFLAAVDPEYAVISCGPDEGDIEPEEKLLERLYDSETTVLRTDEQGTIIVVCDKENLTWNKGME